MIKNITLFYIFLFAVTVQSQNEKYTIHNLEINNAYSNFGTAFYGEDKVVFASPKKKSYIIRNLWATNQQPFLDLYIGAVVENSELKNVQKFSRIVNTRFHEADVAFTNDKKTVYFSRNNYLNKDYKKDSTGVNLIQLYKAEQDANGVWSNITAMSFNSDEYQTGHPTLSSDEKTLYFISDMPGGFGKTDIYKVLILEDGSVAAPVNLGPEINTAEKEMFPFISGNNILYYSSNGYKAGLDDLDIYVAKIDHSEHIVPQNLGAPINSVKDDFAFLINGKTNKGYFSSNRNGGKGDDDIYSFTQHKPINFECTVNVVGVITNVDSGVLLPGALVVLFDENNNELDKVIVSKNATYSFEIDCNKSYKIGGFKEGFSKTVKEFSSNKEENIELPLAIKLDDFEFKNNKYIIKINPIFFDLNKSNIRLDAAIELEKVVEIMKKNPDLRIELGSHTDSRAPDQYNMDLSERRAKSTLAWLVKRGVNEAAISGKGYGETQLVNKCSNGVPCTKANHQLNRRTEFVIVNPSAIK